MKTVSFLVIIMLLYSGIIFSQVAINETGDPADGSAMLDVQSVSKGILIPKVTRAQRNNIASPATGLMVFQTNYDSGFYYYNGTAWVVIGAETFSIDDLSDGKTTGNNIYLGEDAGANDDASNNQNAALGREALYKNTSGFNNSAIGYFALDSNTTGHNNVAFGLRASEKNTTGQFNTSLGARANYNNQEGSNNTIIGYEAGRGISEHNKSGNVFIGYQAGFNETGDNKLYIANSGDNPPLIYGDFSTGNIGLGTLNPASRLTIQNNNPDNWNHMLTLFAPNAADGTHTAGIVFGRANTQNEAGIIHFVPSSTLGEGRISMGISWYDDLFNIEGNGNVGIGTVSPEFKLSLENDGGIIAKGTYESGNILTTSGSGPLLIWYPRKAAFRAGYVNNNAWDDEYIGYVSCALGGNTKAIGTGSVAIGYGAEAGGNYTVALGGGHTIGSNSTVIGGGTSNGAGSIAVGGGTSNGAHSTAIGNGTEANGEKSMALGTQTTANGNSSTTLGLNTISDAYASLAVGKYNLGGGRADSSVSTDPIFEIGVGTGNSDRANALTVLKNGNVGIGTAFPEHTLEISGILDMDGIISFNDTQVVYLPDQEDYLGTLYIGNGGNYLDHNDLYFWYGRNITAVGIDALSANTIGWENTAIGYQALYSNTEGRYNTACGAYALTENIAGLYNTACGNSALSANTGGSENSAFGMYALELNSTGMYNTAVGYAALTHCLTGINDVAVGHSALHNNTTGYRNASFGREALYSNTTGYSNTAIGDSALYNNTEGYCNTALGRNTRVSGSNLHNTTAIGYNALVNTSNKVVIGNSSVTAIGGYANWSNYSDRRLKENIVYKDDLGLDFILKLKTVSFNYTEDENKRRRDGLIAQDVEAVLVELGVDFSGLIIDDDEMKTMNLSYDSFVIPLINAIKEQQKQIDELKKQINKE